MCGILVKVASRYMVVLAFAHPRVALVLTLLGVAACVVLVAALMHTARRILRRLRSRGRRMEIA